MGADQDEVREDLKSMTTQHMGRGPSTHFDEGQVIVDMQGFTDPSPGWSLKQHSKREVSGKYEEQKKLAIAASVEVKSYSASDNASDELLEVTADARGLERGDASR